ncbi:subtilisin-chymotrypsin inhibitor-2a [Phtheirospermum japonicum]|uniref:Subtilisin-chymotrypsin inhibitor-2a n=1 Tax=Phtheirospermum japonicum TaxID=374723 RepID=A0A830D0D1_9LAMI|nr:subtilisin-chymotrypsin inhibitor-2a [Phtheirospermum japonicum]
MGGWTCAHPCFPQAPSRYKTSWPNVVGMPAEQATRIIVHDNPLVSVFPLPKGSATIPKFCCNQVWLPVDENNRV